MKLIALDHVSRQIDGLVRLSVESQLAQHLVKKLIILTFTKLNLGSDYYGMSK